MKRPLALLALCLLALSGSACNRTPTLMPAGADSTQGSPDSMSVYARRAADYWDAGDDIAAAGLSARVVLEALRLRPTAPWPERSQGVLDSLSIASESVGDERMLVLNLFSRARGGDSSYPYLFWREGGPRMQPLEAADLHLVAVAGRGFTRSSEATDSSYAAVLWGRRVGTGQQPLLMVWKHARGGRWDLAQLLGADSLGGTGTGEFVEDNTDLALTTRTYRPTAYFDECTTCPHVYRQRRFEWQAGAFERTGDTAVPSPYVSFTSFIAALVADDRPQASRYVVDPSLIDFARRYDWNDSGRGRWRIAPVSDERSASMVFLRGSGEAYRVSFESRDGAWVIAGFEATTQPME